MKLASLLVVMLLGGVAHASPGAKGQLRQLLLQNFDRDQDGRLGPQERKQAAKALRRVAHRLMRAEMRAGMKHKRNRRFVRRFDLDHDGNVGPGEMPPALADELRPLDRDGDGWLQGKELP